MNENYSYIEYIRDVTKNYASDVKKNDLKRKGDKSLKNSKERMSEVTREIRGSQ